VKFATAVGASSLSALRAMPAEQLLEATAKEGMPRFGTAVDSYFLPKRPADIFAAGEQAHVPLLVGWNSEENNYRSILRDAEPTPENYAQAIKKLYPERADEVLKLYPGGSREEVLQSATSLASDRFIAYSTWKWADLHGKTGGKPVFRYFYTRPRPAMNAPTDGSGPAPQAPPQPARGASHSAEIEYAMGNLATNKVYAWTPDDHKVSEIFQAYFSNFVKTGDPNGPGVPSWSPANRGDAVSVLRIDVDTRAEPEQHRERYVFLDQVFKPKS
jgi:para-nitrobenzyl esterase